MQSSTAVVMFFGCLMATALVVATVALAVLGRMLVSRQTPARPSRLLRYPRRMQRFLLLS